MDKMNFEEFKNEVVDKIKDFLPESFSDAKVSLQVILKNNNLSLTGLIIRKLNNNIAPTLYLENFFERYENGTEMYVLLKEIADTYMAHDVDTPFDLTAITEFSNCSAHIMPRLINREQNSNMLEQRPYTVFLDIAVVYCIELNNFNTGNASIPISNTLIELWNVSVDELHQLALSNLANQQHIIFHSMSEILKEMMFPKLLNEYNGDAEKANQHLSEMIPDDDLMYVLSNQSKVYGATAILDNTTLSNISKQLDNDYYILPSSIHETIIVPYSECIETAQLKIMVEEVNNTEVAPDEILSDTVYIYKDGGIHIAE